MVTSYNSRKLAKVWPGIVCSITCPNKNTPKCVKAVIYLPGRWNFRVSTISKSAISVYSKQLAGPFTGSCCKISWKVLIERDCSLEVKLGASKPDHTSLVLHSQWSFQKLPVPEHRTWTGSGFQAQWALWRCVCYQRSGMMVIMGQRKWSQALLVF